MEGEIIMEAAVMEEEDNPTLKGIRCSSNRKK
jgi:hypothetical protein